MNITSLTRADGIVNMTVEHAKTQTALSETDAASLPMPDDRRQIRLLVFTSLYPNAAQPRHGVFVEERLRKLVASGRIVATVVAPVPWFPFRHPRFGTYTAFAKVPAREERFGILIEHPRYPVIPKLGMNIAPFLMYCTLLPVLRERLATGKDFDVIDAHYFYPDGIAAARLGEAIGKPVVITARGNDLTLLPAYRTPRRQIQWAAERVAAITTVSQALKDKAVTLGVSHDKITVLRNGVDLERFRPMDRTEIRADLNLVGPVWLTVGHLIERKGVHIAIEALARTDDVTLLIAGDGPEAPRLRRLVSRLGIAHRVRFLGAISHDELCPCYNAADALVHPASREGMPNVVLESLACGTPVVAAPFDGVLEVIGTPEAGQVAASRTAGAIHEAWMRLWKGPYERKATRCYAERFTWDATVRSQLSLYTDVLGVQRIGVWQGAAP